MIVALLVCISMPAFAVPYIELRGAVEPGMAAYVERVVSTLEEAGEEKLLILIDSPGGRVDSVERISNTLLATSLRTVAYVERQAISAAALIAISCNTIVMNPSAVMGDAQPINLSDYSTSEKAVSWVRGIFRSAAEARGRDKSIAEGMVDASLDVEGIAPTGKLVVLTADEALEVNFTDYIEDNIQNAQTSADISGELEEYGINWSEKLARIITNPYFTSIILWLGFTGVLYELMTSQGTGAILAVSAFSVFFFGSHVAGLAEWQTVLAFVAGIALLGAEVFVTPGFGLLGIMGALMMLVSLLLSFPGLDAAIQSIAAAMLLTSIAGYVMYRRMPSSKAWKNIVLNEELSVSEGYTPPAQEVFVEVGNKGIAVTPLKPLGRAVFKGRKIEVSAIEGYIDVDSAVQVCEVRGNRVFVRTVTT